MKPPYNIISANLSVNILFKVLNVMFGCDKEFKKLKPLVGFPVYWTEQHPGPRRVLLWPEPPPGVKIYELSKWVYVP